VNRNFVSGPRLSAELLEYDLNADPHEFRDLRISRLGAFFIVGSLDIEARLPDLDEVADDFRDSVAFAERALEARSARS
jgi:hypothetical protein